MFSKISSAVVLSFTAVLSSSVVAFASTGDYGSSIDSSNNSHYGEAGDYDTGGATIVKPVEMLKAEQFAKNLLDNAESVTFYVKVDNVGKTLRAAPERLDKALEDNGIKLNPLDEVSASRDSIVKDKQFVVVSRIVSKPFEKTFKDVKFKTIQGKTEVECGLGEKTKVTTKGALGSRVELWEDVFREGVKFSSRKTGEKVTVQPIDEVVSPCKKIVVPVVPEKVDYSSSSSNNSSRERTVTLTVPGGGNTSLESSSESGSSNSDNSSSDSTVLSTDNGSDSSSTDTVVISGGKVDWLKAAGIAEEDWGYVDYIVEHESGWDPLAVNKKSRATGLCQSLPASKMRSAGEDYLTNPVTQLKWCDSYAKDRYPGGWSGAYKFWVNNHWW